VVNAVYQIHVAGIAICEFAWALVRRLLAGLADAWREPDLGIWAVRGTASTSPTRS
jgi:GH15 family glucan-1,4-alpha-glucosidase